MFGETPRKVARFILKFRWPIILINTLVLVLLLATFAKRGQLFQEHVEYMTVLRNNPLTKNPDHIAPTPIFNSDYHVWFDENNQELKAFDEFQKIFSKDDNLIVVVIAQNGDIFTNDNLKSLKFLTDQAWTVPYVARVDGLTNFNYTYVDDDDLLVEDFIDETPFAPKQLIEKKKLALADSLLPHFVISPKGDITQIQLRVIIPPDFPTGNLATKAGIEAVVAKITQKQVADENGQLVANPHYNPNLEIRLAGTVMLSSAFQAFALKDMRTLMPAMFIFIMIVLFISLRSFWGTISPILLLISSVFFPIALFVGLLQFSLNNATMNVIQMLIAVAIADSVHILAIFYRGLRNGLDKKAAVTFTVEKNFLPCLITSLTTAIGFFSLTLQDIPPFRDLGLFGGVGTLYAFMASTFTLPAFLSILPFKRKKIDLKQIETHESKGYEGLVDFIIKYQSLIRIVALLSIIAAVYFIFQIKVDNNAVKYFAKHTSFRQATHYIDENIIGVNPVEFSFDSGEENGIYEPAFLKSIERFQAYIASHPEYNITYVSGITDIIKRINQTMHGNNPTYYKIPEQGETTAAGDSIDARKLIAQYMLLYQMSLPQGMELTNQIDLRNQITRVTAFTRSTSSFKMLEDMKTIKKWMHENMPSIEVETVGVAIMFGQLFKIAIPGMLKSLAVSLFFITIALMVTFRSVKIGLYSMIPNIWPIAFMFGIIGLTGITVNMSVATVGMITLGIAVDDTVHFLTKYLRGAREGKGQRYAILYSLRQVAAPLFFTSIILLAGFGSLLRSDFVLNSDLGLYCGGIIALALLADFILLPAVILKFDKS